MLNSTMKCFVEDDMSDFQIEIEEMVVYSGLSVDEIALELAIPVEWVEAVQQRYYQYS